MPAKFTDPMKEAERRISEWIRFRFLFAPIDLSNLGLSVLPARLFTLPPLQRLCLAGNKFTNLPDDLGRLEKLIDLDVGENQLETLPEGLASLTALQTLRAENNRLAGLPDSFFAPDALPALLTLHLRGNPALGIPDEVLGRSLKETRHPDEYFMDGEAKPILDYYREHCLSRNVQRAEA
jgi:hypothetical protein